MEFIMTEYSFNGKPLTKVTNQEESSAFNQQYEAEVRAGHTPSILPYDANYINKNAHWVFYQIASPDNKDSYKLAIGVMTESFKYATNEEKDSLMYRMLNFTRNNQGYANRNLGQLASELYRKDEGKVDFSYLTRCYMKLNAKEYSAFSSVSLKEENPKGEAGNFEKKYTPSLFENLNFDEKTMFLRGVAINKYGYIYTEVLENFVVDATKNHSGASNVAYILPSFKNKLADNNHSSLTKIKDKIIGLANNERNAETKEALLYGAMGIGININSGDIYSSPLKTAYNKALTHRLADNELEKWQKNHTIYNFAELLEYHQDKLTFDKEHLEKVNSSQRLKVYQEKNNLSPQNKTELAITLIDENLAGGKVIEQIIDNEAKVSQPNDRNLELSEKLKNKVKIFKANVERYQEQADKAENTLKKEKQAEKQFKKMHLTYKQQANLLNAAAKIKALDNKNSPKFPLDIMEIIIANAFNGREPAQIKEHNIGFFTLGKEQKRLQNNAIAEFNSVLRDVVQKPSGLKEYTGKILDDATTRTITKQYNEASNEYNKVEREAGYARNDLNWIKQELPDLKIIVEKFDALYKAQEPARNEKARQEHLSEVREKAKESLKKKGMSVDEKFGGIEADKKAKKIIRKNSLEQIRKENAEGKGFVTMREKAEKAIDDMAQADANRLNKILENQSGIDMEKAKEAIVQKDKHVRGQNSVEYTQKVKEKMQKNK